IKFSPTTAGDHAGAINISAGTASTSLLVTAVGDASPAASVANDALGITASSANLSASVTIAGCSAVTAYGFEYSTINNFVEGAGINVSANNNGNDFSATLNALVPATTYYFRAYTQNAG